MVQQEVAESSSSGGVNYMDWIFRAVTTPLKFLTPGDFWRDSTISSLELGRLLMASLERRGGFRRGTARRTRRVTTHQNPLVTDLVGGKQTHGDQLYALEQHVPMSARLAAAKDLARLASAEEPGRGPCRIPLARRLRDRRARGHPQGQWKGAAAPGRSRAIQSGCVRSMIPRNRRHGHTGLGGHDGRVDLSWSTCPVATAPS